MESNYQRQTKIERIRNLDGGVLHVGDLVAHFWNACASSRMIEGQIVDIVRHRVVIEEADGTLAYVWANSVRESEVVERA